MKNGENMINRDDFVKFAVDNVIKNVPLEKRLRLLSDDYYESATNERNYLVNYAKLEAKYVKPIDEQRSITLNIIVPVPEENYKNFSAVCLFVADKGDKKKIKSARNKPFVQFQIFFTTGIAEYGIYSRQVRFSHSGLNDIIKGRKIYSSDYRILYLRSYYDERKFLHHLIKTNLNHLLYEQLASIKEFFKPAYLISDKDLQKNREEFEEQFDFKLVCPSKYIVNIVSNALQDLGCEPISGGNH